MSGRFAQIWDTDRWNLDFPAELADRSNLLFKSGLAVSPTNAAANKIVRNFFENMKIREEIGL
jgi:hypothetical protein